MVRRNAGGRVLRKRRKRAAPRTVSPTPTSSFASTNSIRLSSEYRRGFPAPTVSAISGRTTPFSAQSTTCRGWSPTFAHTAAREWPRGGMYVPVYSLRRSASMRCAPRLFFSHLTSVREHVALDLRYVPRQEIRGGVRGEGAQPRSFASRACEFEDARALPTPARASLQDACMSAVRFPDEPMKDLF